MAEVENHFTVFIRLPFNRGDFVDPPPVSWSAAKERALWDVISRGQSKGYEIDWHGLAARFEVSQPFILQQAAWLYERQLSQVRAQMRRVGNRPSTATSSPTPGSVTSSQMVAAAGGSSQPMKRVGSGGSRVPSRLSAHYPAPPLEGSATTTATTTTTTTPLSPGKNRPSLPIRIPSAGQGPSSRPSSGFSRPASQSKEVAADYARRTHSRGDSGQHQISRQDGDSDLSHSKLDSRRSNPLSLHRRSLSRKDYQPAITQSPRALSPAESEDADDGGDNGGGGNSSISSSNDNDDDDDDGDDDNDDANDDDDDDDDDQDDSPSFLPFVTETSSRSGQTESPSQDPGATIKGAFDSETAASQPPNRRRSRTDTIQQAAAASAATAAAAATTTTSPGHHISSSTSSLSSASNPPIGSLLLHTTASSPPPPAAALTPAGITRRGLQRGANANANANVNPNPNPSNANALSPRQQAALANAAGMSPHRRMLGPGGSPSSPSMGSSFSDLEDASVTQSALEEALMSNLGNTTTTIAGVGAGAGSIGGGGGGTAGGGGGGGGSSAAGVASRMTTGISQALRSRYFDARGAAQGGQQQQQQQGRKS